MPGNLRGVGSKDDFNKKAQWLIGELQDVDFPFFVKWFDDWKRRAFRSEKPPEINVC